VVAGAEVDELLDELEELVDDVVFSVVVEVDVLSVLVDVASDLGALSPFAEGERESVR
jgi:hypothetical protein